MDMLNLSLSVLTPVLGAGIDISNLRSFMSGDAVYVISVIAAIFVGKYWKDGNIVKIFGVLVIYAIIAILLKGTQMLNFLSGILEWFGINSGL